MILNNIDDQNNDNILHYRQMYLTQLMYSAVQIHYRLCCRSNLLALHFHFLVLLLNLGSKCCNFSIGVIQLGPDILQLVDEVLLGHRDSLGSWALELLVSVTA